MKNKYFSRFLISVFVILSTVTFSLAATSPNLATATTFSILSSTYTNTIIGTTLNGDLGYTTGPVTAPTVNGVTHTADSIYNQAGIDQGTALAALNSQACSFSFAPGAIDLASDTTHGTVGVYAPGVYCVTGSASIGGGGTITLTGNGAYIFKITGGFTTSANSIVALSGSSSCDVWWAPGAATTLGANSSMKGTVIDASGITIGNAVTWAGRALAFGGTVSTSADTITVPTCTSSTPTVTPTAGVTTSVPVTTTPAGRRLVDTGSNPILSIFISGVIVSTITVTFISRKNIKRRNRSTFN